MWATGTPIWIVIAAAAAALGAPAVAEATDRYVSKSGANNPTCNQSQPCLTVQHATGTVAQNDDRIHIGPGTYDEPVLTSKRLHFEGAGAGGFAGLGPGDTLVRSVSTNDPALRMLGGGSVRNLRLQGASAPPAPTPQPGLLLSAIAFGDPLSYTVEDVFAVGGTQGAFGESGIRVDDGGTNRTIDASLRAGLPVGLGSGLLVHGANVSSTATGTEIRSLANAGLAATAMVIEAGAELELARSTIADDLAPMRGILVADPGSRLSMDRSRVVLRRSPLRILTNNPGATTGATVINSVVANGDQVGPGQPAIAVSNSGGAGSKTSLIVRGSTIVARGPQVYAALSVGAVNPGSSVAAESTNTVIRATDTDAGPADVDVQVGAGSDTTASFAASTSSFTDLAATGAGASATPPGTGTNLSGDPRFAGEATGDLHLAADSPLVDRGEPVGLSTSELDLDGGPRSVDGNGDCIAAPDIGAFERPAVTCSQPASAGPGTAPATPSVPAAAAPDLLAATIEGFGLERNRFAVGRGATAVAGRRRAPTGSTFRYSISEDATVRIAIERKTKGLRSGTKCAKPTKKLRKRHAKRCVRYTSAGTLTRTAKQGANRHPFTGRIGRRALKPGRYRATITAADAAGNVSGPTSATFTILRARGG
jgi:hypothetical protein